MLNAREVVARVKQGIYPSNWDVYQGTGNYGCTVLAVICMAFFIWMGSTMTCNTGTFLIASIPCTICVIAIIISSSKAAMNKRSLLIILPDGVVKCNGGNLNEVYWLQFSDIKRIELARETEVSGNEDGISTTTFYWLDIYSHDGEYRKWQILDHFGDTACLCKNIIAAYDHYRGYQKQRPFYHRH